VANFKPTPQTGCSPLIVKFLNTSSGASSYEWDFGNGNKSTLKDPSAIYYVPGYYTVKLIAKDASGASDEKIISKIRVFKNPSANFTAVSRDICENEVANFRSTSQEGDTTISFFSWDFGDGSLGKGANPKHVYTKSGKYKVSLYVQDRNGCTSDKIITDFINVKNTPDASYSVDETAFCSSPATVKFSNNSSRVTPHTYFWMFGDGKTDKTTNPSHTYSSFGSYSHQLVVTGSNGCRDTAQGPDKIEINPLKAEINLIEDPCGPSKFSFKSIVTPAYNNLTYLWNFGSGKTSTLPDPDITLSPGTYTVKLSVYNAECYDDVQQTIVIREKPKGNLSLEPDAICKLPESLKMSFSPGSYSSYRWFVNGKYVGSGKSLNHNYYDESQANVRVEVENDGCKVSFTDSVAYSNPQIEIDPDTSGCAPLPVNLRIRTHSGAAITDYRWDFGDGKSSTAKSPKHTFSDTGVFTVKLTITDAFGCTATATTQVKTGVKVEPNFTYDTSAVCNLESKFFENLTNETPYKPDFYTWIIGGQEVKRQSGDLDHIIRLPPGSKEVSLITEHRGCKDTFTHPLEFIVKDPYSSPLVVADTCGPSDAIFVNQSIGETSFNWLGYPVNGKTDDTIRMTLQPGYYRVGIATYSSKTQCRDTGFVELAIANSPQLDVKYAGNIDCPPISLELDIETAYANKILINSNGVEKDYSSYLPKFSVSVSNMPSVFGIEISASNSSGCTTKESKSFSGKGPLANGSLSSSGTCLPYDLALYDSTFGKDSYDHFWVIGNSPPVKVTSASMNLQLDEKIVGKSDVPVRLIVGSDTCKDFKVFNVPVNSFDAKISQISDISCNTIAYGLSVKALPDTFSSLSYQWGINGKWKSFQFNNQTTYLREMDGSVDTVQVRIKRSNGCTSMFTHLLTKPKARLAAVLSADTTGSPCPPLYVNFKDSSWSLNRKIVKWEWDLGDGTYSQKQNPGKMYLLPGKYSVGLRVTDNRGCITESLYPDLVTIEGPKVTKSILPLSGCVPLDVEFFANSDEEVFYQWDLGDGNVVAEPNPKHTYNQPGMYIPLLTVRDSFGCSYTLPPTDTIRVSSYPFADFQLTGNCAGDTSDFLFTGFANGSKLKSVNWDFGDGSKATGPDVQHVFKAGGFHRIGLSIFTEQGCKDSISRKVRVFGAAPGFRLSKGGMCFGDSISIRNTSTADTTVAYTEWKLGDSVLGVKGDPFYLRIHKPGIYPLSLNLVTVNGCSYPYTDGEDIVVGDTIKLAPAVIKRTSVLDDYRIDLKIVQNPDLYLAGHSVWMKSQNSSFKRQFQFDKDDTMAVLGGLNTLQESYCMVVQRDNFCESSAPKDTSSMHCTVEIKAEGDTLRNILTWSPYIGWQEVDKYAIYSRLEEENSFSLLTETDGKTFIYYDTAFDCLVKKRYHIQAIEKDGFEERSWSDTAAAQPRWGYNVPAPEIWRTSVEEDKYTILEWLMPVKAALPLTEFELYRAQGNELIRSWDRMDASQYDTDDYKVKVDDVSYRYQVRAKDKCDNWSPLSNEAKTVVLNVNFNWDTRQPEMSWSKYTYWNEGVEYYIVERLQENGEFLTIGRTIDDQDTFFIDEVAVEQCNPNYCYRVTAIRNQPVNYPDSSHSAISHSNVDCAVVESHLYVPNAFTMNGDNLNETFQPRGMYLKDYHMRIFNRWGEKLFETWECFGSWDGTYKGEPCQDEAYMYIINAIGSDDKIHHKTGTVHLLK